MSVCGQELLEDGLVHSSLDCFGVGVSLPYGPLWHSRAVLFTWLNIKQRSLTFCLQTVLQPSPSNTFNALLSLKTTHLHFSHSASNRTSLYIMSYFFLHFRWYLTDSHCLIVALHDYTAKEMINNQLQSEAVNSWSWSKRMYSAFQGSGAFYTYYNWKQWERKCKDKIGSKLLSKAHLNSLMPEKVVLFFLKKCFSAKTDFKILFLCFNIPTVDVWQWQLFFWHMGWRCCHCYNNASLISFIVTVTGWCCTWLSGLVESTLVFDIEGIWWQQRC